ncbi:AI-2E family transporter [Zhihengliuella salsuginis]|uniref:AI-2E family transporter n=1 Tax=Zhihengliuella salsuginis TaxID=578222 RepID=A0ABQ3GIH9_9MICC|nr:AI-2E family transporter [Zhihengliuella salsuginis]GHD08893.1 AI-2E family transporter [Zhihengliuella salsuginis]
MSATEPTPTESVEPPAERTSWALIRHPFATGFFLTVGGLTALALGLAITNLSTVLVYIAFALFIALGLDPLVRRISRSRLSRAWSIVVVCGGFVTALAGVLLLIIPTVVGQVSQFVRSLPALISDFQASDLYLWLEDTFGDRVGSMLADAQTFLTDPSNIAAIGGGVLQVGTTVATTLSGVVIVMVLGLYFLASLPTMKKSLIRLAPARNRVAVRRITEEITASVGSYLAGMVVLAFINAVFVFLLHLVLGLPFPQLMAVTAFCITLIPLIGSVVFWVLGTFLALFTSPADALAFGIAYLVYMQLEAYLLTPRVMNRTIAVPGSLVVIGALVGGTLLGLLGALVAIPVTASILLIIKQVLIPRQDRKA